MNNRLNITLLVSYSGDGGVEVITNNFCAGLVNAGHNVTILLIRTKSARLIELPSQVKQIRLKRSSAWLTVPELTRYLKTEKPDLFIAIKDRAVQATAVAKFLARYEGVTIGQIHNNMTAGLDNRHPILRRIRYYLMSRLYPALDHIVAVSEDAALAIIDITGLTPQKVTSLPNPIITDALKKNAVEQPGHQWLLDKQLPVIVGIGRFSPQKNFSNLLKAFSIVQRDHQCRLIIFGEGKLRTSLEQEVQNLAIEHLVDLPGFVRNPYAELQNADAFVLSSDWEGSPTVLCEALALGIPCVATDVGDTSTTLKNGEVGPIVATRDPEALAQAIKSMLKNPPDRRTLIESTKKFRVDESTSRYIKFFDGIFERNKEANL